jgi:hypothetical protein
LQLLNILSLKSLKSHFNAITLAKIMDPKPGPTLNFIKRDPKRKHIPLAPLGATFPFTVP